MQNASQTEASIEEILALYAELVFPGAREPLSRDHTRSEARRKWLPRVLRQCSVERVKRSVRNFAVAMERTGQGRQYRLRVRNFFGRDERWRDFLELEEPEREPETLIHKYHV